VWSRTVQRLDALLSRTGGASEVLEKIAIPDSSPQTPAFEEDAGPAFTGKMSKSSRIPGILDLDRAVTQTASSAGAASSSSFSADDTILLNVHSAGKADRTQNNQGSFRIR
jgi:hypothetical protein